MPVYQPWAIFFISHLVYLTGFDTYGKRMFKKELTHSEVTPGILPYFVKKGTGAEEGFSKRGSGSGLR